jgi:hypothetical protein
MSDTNECLIHTRKFNMVCLMEGALPQSLQPHPPLGHECRSNPPKLQ